MNSNNMINRVITLQNNNKFLVLNQAIYKEESYLLIYGLNDKENGITGEIYVVKQVLSDQGPKLEIVKDQELLQLLFKHLV